MNDVEEIPLPVGEVDLAKFPCTPSAWEWMTGESPWVGCANPGSYFTRVDLTRVAEALGRQLTLAEVKELVVPDEAETNCFVCGKKFQPLRWLIPTKEFLKLQQEATTSIAEAVMKVGVFRGSFFISPSGEIGAVCGPPFQYSPDRGTYFHPSHSCLVISHRVTGQWGMPLAMAKQITDRRRKVDNLTQKARELFEKRGLPSQNKGGTARFTNPPRFIVES